MLRLLVLILSLVVSATYADTIYKSVDDEGNVIYSAEPPSDGGKVKALKAPPEASDEEKEAAAERQRRLETFLDESGESGDAVARDGERRREAAKPRTVWQRRAIWGENWPVHEPPNK